MFMHTLRRTIMFVAWCLRGVCGIERNQNFFLDQNFKIQTKRAAKQNKNRRED